MIAPADLLLYAGGACLERYGRLWRVTRPADRAGEEAAPTVTRATVGTYIDRDGILRSAASGVPRVDWLDLDGDGVRRPCLLVEPARTQVAANPQAPNSWDAAGVSPIITAGQVDPWGGTAAILIEDDDPASEEGKLSACTFTGDGTKVVLAVARAGTAAVIQVALRDETAGVWRHKATVTWAGGVTAPSLATTDGAGTLFSPIPIYDPAGSLWWAVAISATGVVAANSNALRVIGTEAGTGTFYLAGGNAWDALYPTSWQATAAARNADAITMPFYVGAGEDLTVHAIMARPAHADISGDLGAHLGVWGISDFSLGRPNLGLAYHKTARQFTVTFTEQNGNGLAASAVLPAGSRVAGTVQWDASERKARVNVGAGWSAYSGAPTQAAFTLWGSPTLKVGAPNEVSGGTSQLAGGLFTLLLARGLHEPADFAAWIP